MRHEIESTLDALADHLAGHLDLDRILEIAAVARDPDRSEQTRATATIAEPAIAQATTIQRQPAADVGGASASRAAAGAHPGVVDDLAA